jgi:hypothetical protein
MKRIYNIPVSSKPFSSLRAIESYFSDPAEYDAHIKEIANINNGWVPLAYIIRLPRVHHALSVVSLL